MLRKLMLGIAVVIYALAFAGMASAEGGFDSSMTNWSQGFTSREWTDRNTDSDDTTIRFSGCNKDSTVELVRKSFPFNQGLGTLGFNCRNQAVTRNWGQVGQGDYFYKLQQIIGGGTLTVNNVSVRY
jgi:hypothetical protein